MTLKELHYVDGELFISDPGATNMARINNNDLETLADYVDDSIAFSAGAAADALGAGLTSTGLITSPAIQTSATARTATADGLTTGAIEAGTSFVTVTCDDANKIVSLPIPAISHVVQLRNGATGYELRTNDPGTVSINGGTGADAESEIAANSLVTCVCDTALTWICMNQTTAGVIAATQVAAP